VRVVEAAATGQPAPTRMVVDRALPPDRKPRFFDRSQEQQLDRKITLIVGNRFFAVTLIEPQQVSDTTTLSGREWVGREIAMKRLFSGFAKNESGATAIEYALIAGGVSIVILGAVNRLGTDLTVAFNNVANTVR